MLNYKIHSGTGTISQEKPVLVFIHGLGGSSTIWVKQVKMLRQKYDLLMIDLPSHGKNNILLSDLPVTFRSVADKILEVLDHLQIKSATFIGVSIGTIFVKYLLLKHPEIVTKYIIIGGMGTLKNWFRIGIQLTKLALSLLPSKFCYSAVGKLIIPKKEYSEGRDLFLKCAKCIPSKEMKDWLTLLARFPAINRQYLRKIKDFDNGLYITGEDDFLFLPMLEPELQLTKHQSILKDCGHLCNLDRPDVVNELIDSFVAA